MKIFSVMRCVSANLAKALSLSVIMVLIVIIAEGLQHIVEWHLGMYESSGVFVSRQGDRLRMSFGILKAITVVTACYIIPKNLSRTYGPPPKHGSFNRDMLRKLWDIRVGMSGVIAMITLAAPLIYLHFKLSYLAMGHPWAAGLLILDSILIGGLALVMGTSVWAGDMIEHEATLTQTSMT